MFILRNTAISAFIGFSLVFSVLLLVHQTQAAPKAQIRNIPEFAPTTVPIQQTLSNPPEDWRVSVNETRQDEVIIVKRLEVDENISLTLLNCLIMVNSTRNDTGQILILGTLMMRDTVIRAVNASYGYRFFLFSLSTFDVEDSTIRDVGKNSVVSRDRGIHVNSQKAIIRNSVISHSWDGLIITTNTSVTIDACQIMNNALSGVRIEARADNTLIENSVIDQNYEGIIFDWRSANNTIRNCLITNSSQTGVSTFHDPSLYYSSVGISSFNNNSIYGNSILNQPIGVSVQYSGFNSIFDNQITSEQAGISLQYTDNNTIYNNSIVSQHDGIVVRFADNNTVTQNAIEAGTTGSGILLDPGASDNRLQENNIRFPEIGIELRGASSNTVIRNQIRETQEMAISIDTCPGGNYLAFNELAVTSGIAIKITDSDFVTLESNTVSASGSITDPAIFLEEAQSCSIFGNQITSIGPAFYLQDSPNNLFSENIATSDLTPLLALNSLSRNVTLYLPISSQATIVLFPRSTLRLIPPEAIKQEIVSMTLYADEQLLSSSSSPTLELVLDSYDIGGGNFTITVSIEFLNGTEEQWSFFVYVQGKVYGNPNREITYATTSNANWNSLLPLVLAMLLLTGWVRKKKNESV
ncbi:MAG: right-handed parallel beta-helix repeat-containing protein [Candidatus Hodarchaeales archaeon]